MNILIVEDEPIALDELEFLLKPFEPEHAIYRASNGLEGLEAAKRCKPDLVITDIRMPGMDGLALIRELKQLAPAVEAIIVSGYDEFEYARTGLQYGVKDYLLKPVKKKALLEAVSNVLAQLEQARCQTQENEEWQVMRALEGRLQEAEEQHLLPGKRLVVLSVKNNLRAEQQWQTDKAAFLQAIAALHKEDQALLQAVQLDLNARCVLVPLAAHNSRELEHAIEIHQWHMQAGEYVHTAATVKKPGEQISTAYRRAASMLERQIQLEASTFSADQNPGLVSPADQISMWNQIRLLEAYVGKRDFKRLYAHIETVMREIRRQRFTVAELGQLFTDMFAALRYNLFKGYNGQGADSGEIMDRLWRMSSYAEVAQWLEQQLLLLAEQIGSSGKEPKELVYKLMNQIRRGHDRSDSLHQFATEHHISVSYLSRLFKAEAGMNFSDYLVQIRMERAKQFLRERGLSVAEVAGQVGYEDSKYFSQLFKKTTGMTPTEFQKSGKIVPPI